MEELFAEELLYARVEIEGRHESRVRGRGLGPSLSLAHARPVALSATLCMCLGLSIYGFHHYQATSPNGAGDYTRRFLTGRP